MKKYIMVTELWCVHDFVYNNQRGITQKLRKGKQSFLYVTHCLELIYIPIKFCEDIPNSYRVMRCTRIFDIKNNQRSITWKLGEDEQQFLLAPNTHSYKIA